jgi:putative lipoprotein
LKNKIIVLIVLLLAGSLLHCHDWLGSDKIAHFGTSMFLTSYTSGCSNDILGETRENSQYLGVGLTLSLGLGKEGFDRYIQNEKWSWEDLAWDLAGIACGLVINNQIME